MRVVWGSRLGLRRLSHVFSVGSGTRSLASASMRLVQFCRRGAEGGVRVGVETESGGGVVDLKAVDQSVPSTMREFLELGQKGRECARRWDRLRRVTFVYLFGWCLFWSKTAYKWEFSPLKQYQRGKKRFLELLGSLLIETLWATRGRVHRRWIIIRAKV